MQTKKMTAAEWISLFMEVGEAIAAAGYELAADGLLHQIGEMFEDCPEPAIEPEMIAPTIGYPKALGSSMGPMGIGDERVESGLVVGARSQWSDTARLWQQVRA